MSQSNECRRPRFAVHFKTTQIKLRSVEEVPPNLLLGLDGHRPKNLRAKLIRNSPIIDARVCPLTNKYSDNNNKLVGDRYQHNEKPVYLKAEINPKNRVGGEGTEVSDELRDLIRSRGHSLTDESGKQTFTDDCGHILAKSLGGKMVHFNLFPQNYRINQGRRPYSRVWKWGLEWMIDRWLWFHRRRKPCVRLQVILLYNECEFLNDYTDRPVSLLFWAEFFKDDDSEDSELDEENDDDWMVVERKFAFEGEFVNRPLEFTAAQAAELTNEINVIIEAFRDCSAESNVDELKEFLKRLIETLEIVLPEPEPGQSTSSISNSWSVWDFVPIVGPLRTISESIDCATKGNKTGCLVNLTIGVTALGLDIFTVGSAGVGIHSACKLANGVGAQYVTRSVMKGAAKEALKQAVISATIDATVGGVLGGRDGAVKGMVSGAVSGAFGGGLKGCANGAMEAWVKEVATQKARDEALKMAKEALEKAKVEARKKSRLDTLRRAEEASKQRAKEKAIQKAKEKAKQETNEELALLLLFSTVGLITAATGLPTPPIK